MIPFCGQWRVETAAGDTSSDSNVEGEGYRWQSLAYNRELVGSLSGQVSFRRMIMGWDASRRSFSVLFRTGILWRCLWSHCFFFPLSPVVTPRSGRG